jgi:hypothetical protein
MAMRPYVIETEALLAIDQIRVRFPHFADRCADGICLT